MLRDYLSSTRASVPISLLPFFIPLGLHFQSVDASPAGYRQPITYNFAVAREVLKQVYITERLQPPTSLGTVANAYSTLWARASNPAYWRELTRSGEWQKVGVYALEAYGLYKVSARVLCARRGATLCSASYWR